MTRELNNKGLDRQLGDLIVASLPSIGEKVKTPQTAELKTVPRTGEFPQLTRRIALVDQLRGDGTAFLAPTEEAECAEAGGEEWECGGEWRCGHVGDRKASDGRRVIGFVHLPLPHLPGRPDAGRAPEGGVPAEIPGAVQSQVDVQDQAVVEVEEQMLAVGGRRGQDVAVQQGGPWREPALVAAHASKPADLDWSTWLGSAEKRDWDPHHYFEWRCYSAYSGGICTDLFIHRITRIMRACDLLYPRRVVGMGGIWQWPDGRDLPDNVEMICEYPRGMTVCSTVHADSNPAASAACNSSTARAGST